MMEDCGNNNIFKVVERLPQLSVASRNKVYILPDGSYNALNRQGNGWVDLAKVNDFILGKIDDSITIQTTEEGANIGVSKLLQNEVAAIDSKLAGKQNTITLRANEGLVGTTTGKPEAREEITLSAANSGTDKQASVVSPKTIKDYVDLMIKQSVDEKLKTFTQVTSRTINFPGTPELYFYKVGNIITLTSQGSFVGAKPKAWSDAGMLPEELQSFMNIYGSSFDPYTPTSVPHFGFHINDKGSFRTSVINGVTASERIHFTYIGKNYDPL